MGFLRSIEAILGTALAFFYDLVPSFGIAIIMLTIAINLVLFPLTLKQTRSTRAFQMIQPEIKRLQKEHKDDPQTMQQEMIKLQRESGATPGGCILPVIVQMPIWFGLFRLLREVSQIVTGDLGTTDLLPGGSALLAAVQRGDVHFLGMSLGRTINQGVTETGGRWWEALPYAMLIVIMVASQYIQQWHATRGQAPKTADLTAQQAQQQKTQQMLTKVMPFFIGFVSWNLPAGLAVYWATSNAFRLGQQFAIFAIDGRPQPVDPDDDATRTGSDDSPDAGGGPGGEETPSKKPHSVSEKKRRRRRR